MKLNLIKVVFLSLINFLFVTSTFPQSVEAPKGTKRIILKNSKTKDENGNFVANNLLNLGYEITDYNKELGTIKTSLKTHKSASYYFYIRYNDNEIILSGMFKANYTIDYGYVQSEPTFYEIENRGMKKSEFKETFLLMYNLSNSLGYDSIEFKQ